MATFKRFQIGPVLAGTLIAAGLETLVYGLTSPVAFWTVNAINYVIRTARFDSTGLAPASISPLLIFYLLLTGVILVLAGVRLGAWLRVS